MTRLIADDNASWTSPTLDMTFDNDKPFEPQFVRTGHGYRMDENGGLVQIVDGESVIEREETHDHR